VRFPGDKVSSNPKKKGLYIYIRNEKSISKKRFFKKINILKISNEFPIANMETQNLQRKNLLLLKRKD